MAKKYKVLGLVLGLIGLALALAIYNLGSILAFVCDGKDEIAKIRFNDETIVVISAEKCWENERAIYYAVNTGSGVLVPTTYLSSEEPEFLAELGFEVVSDKSGMLFGVVERRLPQKVWLLYHTKTGETWPRCESGGMELCERKGEEFLEELRKAHPDVSLTL